MRFEISVKIHVHAYGEDTLCDEILDDYLSRCGVNPPNSINPLYNMRDQTARIAINENTSSEEFLNKLYFSIWGDNWANLAIGQVYFELIDNCRAEIDNPNVNFSYLLDKYLDPNKSNLIQVSFYVCTDAGDVLKYENLRFYMPSKEKGHNKPHVHIEDTKTGNTCSVCILDGEKLAGDVFRQKDLRKAQHIISEKREFFIECWNKLTDGLKVDINHELGLIKY